MVIMKKEQGYPVLTWKSFRLIDDGRMRNSGRGSSGTLNVLTGALASSVRAMVATSTAASWGPLTSFGGCSRAMASMRPRNTGAGGLGGGGGTGAKATSASILSWILILKVSSNSFLSFWVSGMFSTSSLEMYWQWPFRHRMKSWVPWKKSYEKIKIHFNTIENTCYGRE